MDHVSRPFPANFGLQVGLGSKQVLAKRHKIGKASSTMSESSVTAGSGATGLVGSAASDAAAAEAKAKMAKQAGWFNLGGPGW